MTTHHLQATTPLLVDAATVADRFQAELALMAEEAEASFAGEDRFVVRRRSSTAATVDFRRQGWHGTWWYRIRPADDGRSPLQRRRPDRTAEPIAA